LDGSGLHPLIATEIISYIFCALALVLSARCILITRGLRRRQALWFTLPCLFSLVGSVLNHIPAVQRVAPLPSGFLLSGLFITWGFHRWQAYNIIPLAHEVVVRNMIDGLMVVDAYGYIANMNSAAKTAMNGMSVAVGGRFAELATGWPALAAALANPGPGSAEVVRNYPGGSRYYQLTTTSLQTAGHFLGKIVIFKDITQQKQDQEKLLNSEKALSILTERNRLSRELHDAQGQFPGYVKTHTQAIRLLLQKGQIEDVDRQLERLTNAAAVAFTDVRESIIGLKTAVEEWDFFKNLQAWLSQFQQSSGIITSYTGPESRLPQWVLPEAEVQLLRIVQEALVNARKHSGADRAEVAFFVGNGNLIVTIADNGRGFDVAKINNSAGFGLEIIRERAEGIGSVCKISSAFDQGTVVTVEVPLVETPGEIAI
jgi:signal transduction histidine kinase